MFPNTPPRTLKKTSKDGPQATTIMGVQSSLTSKMVEALSEPFRNPPASFHVTLNPNIHSIRWGNSTGFVQDTYGVRCAQV